MQAHSQYSKAQSASALHDEHLREGTYYDSGPGCIAKGDIFIKYKEHCRKALPALLRHVCKIQKRPLILIQVLFALFMITRLCCLGYYCYFLLECARALARCSDAWHSQATIDAQHSQATIDAQHSQATVDAQHFQATLDAQHSQVTVDAQHSQAAIDAYRFQATIDAQHSQATIDAQHSQAAIDANRFQATIDAQRPTVGVMLKHSDVI